MNNDNFEIHDRIHHIGVCIDRSFAAGISSPNNSVITAAANLITMQDIAAIKSYFRTEVM